MPHQLVKIIENDDREITGDNNWHLVDPSDPCGDSTLCTGEFFGIGEGDVVYETKYVMRGGVTCPRCLERLKTYKAIKL